MTHEATAEATSTTTRDPRTLTAQEATTRFHAVVAEVIGVESYALDQHFLDIGGDSLSMVIIIDWIGQELGTEPEVDWFFESQDMKELGDRWWAKHQA